MDWPADLSAPVTWEGLAADLMRHDEVLCVTHQRKDARQLAELVPGRHFSEVSGMLSIREWRHRRSVTPEGSGCFLQDEIAFTPRLRLMGPIQVWLSRLVFKRRHRALRRLFDGGAR